MKSKSWYLIAAVFALAAGMVFWWLQPAKPAFRQVAFQQLPGWEKGEFKKSLLTFQTSCNAFIKQEPDRMVGTDILDLQVKDWLPACRAALAMHDVKEKAAKEFFQHWFTPIEFYEGKPVKGLFTGYYLPLLKGSMTKSERFSVPVYAVPDDLVSVDLSAFSPEFKKRVLVGRVEGRKLVPYYTREQINQGAIKDHASVLLWLNNPLDRLFLEIQGTGIVELEDGEKVFIGYDAQNGAAYTAIAGVLIKRGVMMKHEASMQLIRQYLEAHPQEMDEVINHNKSFIFFRKLSMRAALGSQGVALTPGYSLAIDKQWIPLGAPLWLSTSRPDSSNPKTSKPMQRLMIAQDTGGAIKGKVRGDVFWGGGDKATLIAGHMKNEGHYWLLLPRHTASRIFRQNP